MNQPPIRTIDDMPGYFGLQIEYRDDLPANNAGYLDPADEPSYIAVNRNLPCCEQVFTIAHELGHYVRHHNKPRRRFFPRLLDREYQSKRVADLACRTRRSLYIIFNIEWEADLYAFCILFNIGAGADIKAYLERHSEKIWMCSLASLVCFFNAIPRMIKGLILKFFKLFTLHKA